MDFTTQEIEIDKIVNATNKITFRATNIEKKKAKIGIYLNDRILEYSYCKYDDAAERNRILNSTYSSLSEIVTAIYTKEDMKHDFRLFCAGLWDQLLDTIPIGAIKGNIDANPTTFLVDPYIMQGAGTILYAPPGKGKSYTALLLAVSIDAGNSNLWPVTQKRVAFVNLERSEESIAR